MSTNPIEHQEYLVRRHLMYRIISEPIYALGLDMLSDSLFEGDKAFENIYSIVKQEYRSTRHNAPIQRDWLRVELAGRLDRLHASIEERGQFDYVVKDIYVMDADLEKSTAMNRKVSEYIRKVRVTNLIKKVVANELSDSAITDFITSVDKVNTETALRELPIPISVLDPSTFEESARLLEELLTSRIPTPFKAYNIGTGGGISKGEMGCIAGSSGTGKSMHLSSLAVGYARSGMNVAYFALEELTPRMIHRFYKNVVNDFVKMSDVTVYDADALKSLADLRSSPDIFRNGLFESVLKDLREKHGINFGNLYLVKYRPYEMSLVELNMSLDDLQKRGCAIDVVMVDYPDLMDYDRSAGESEAGGRLFASLRGVGQKFDVIMWVASQLNRTTHGVEIKTEAHIEGSYRKQNSLEFLAIINQTSEEYEAGFTRIYIGKARNSRNKGEILQMTVQGALGALRDQTPHETLRHNRILNEEVVAMKTKPKKDAQVLNSGTYLSNINSDVRGGLQRQAKGENK